MGPEFYAHSHPDFPNDPSKWHKLKDHLKSVARESRNWTEKRHCGWE